MKQINVIPGLICAAILYIASFVVLYTLLTSASIKHGYVVLFFFYVLWVIYSVTKDLKTIIRGSNKGYGR